MPELTDRWWAIREGALLDALRQVAAGDHPDIVMAELVANSDHEEEPGE